MFPTFHYLMLWLLCGICLVYGDSASSSSNDREPHYIYSVEGYRTRLPDCIISHVQVSSLTAPIPPDGLQNNEMKRCFTGFGATATNTTCGAGEVGCITVSCIDSADGTLTHPIATCATASQVSAITPQCTASGSLVCCTNACLTDEDPCNEEHPIEQACDNENSPDCEECEYCVPQTGPLANVGATCVTRSLLCQLCVAQSSASDSDSESGGEYRCVTGFDPRVTTTCAAGEVGCLTSSCIDPTDGTLTYPLAVCGTASDVSTSTSLCTAAGSLICCAHACTTGEEPCNERHPIELACASTECEDCEHCVPQTGPLATVGTDCVTTSGCTDDRK